MNNKMKLALFVYLHLYHCKGAINMWNKTLTVYLSIRKNTKVIKLRRILFQSPVISLFIYKVLPLR